MISGWKMESLFLFIMNDIMPTKRDIGMIYNDDDRQYLQMMQDSIARMAGNSANCKTWLVTLVSAMLTAGVAVQSLSHWMFISLFPIFVLWRLDVYYLKLERGLRNRQRLFINIVNAVEYNADEYKKALYNFQTYEYPKDDGEQGLKTTEKLGLTESVCPFYPIIMGATVIISVVLLFVPQTY